MQELPKKKLLALERRQTKGDCKWVNCEQDHFLWREIESFNIYRISSLSLSLSLSLEPRQLSIPLERNEEQIQTSESISLEVCVWAQLFIGNKFLCQ